MQGEAVSGPTDFTPISLDKAVESHVKLNGGDPVMVRRGFKMRIAEKKGGKMCEVCEGLPVWAFGGCGMCFSCTTGEADASEDYEFEEVCF